MKYCRGEDTEVWEGCADLAHEGHKGNVSHDD